MRTVAVVTLTQPCVLQDGDRAAREDETSRIIGPPGVGRKDDIEVLVSIARAQDRLRVFPAMVGQRDIIVARREIGSIMIGLGVDLKPDIKHHTPPPSSSLVHRHA